MPGEIGCHPLESAFLLSAQRFFIASEIRFLPAGVIPPPRFLGAGLATVDTFFTVTSDFALRAAQYALIAAACRFLPAGVIPPRRLGSALLLTRDLVGPVRPAPSSRALMAMPIRSCSAFNTAMILSRSNSDLHLMILGG